MKRFLTRVLLVSSLALAAGATLAPNPAEARVAIGIGLGIPLFAPAYPPPAYAYYPPYYYAPPPAYYPPPQAVPPAAYYPPPQAVPAPSAVAGQQCREYTSTQTIAGSRQTVVGTACRQPDGTWRIVN